MSDKSDYCPKTDKCPLFKGDMLASEKAQEIYMRLYCISGEIGQSRCKRFQIVKEGYRPADTVMPNDERTTQQIIDDKDIID